MELEGVKEPPVVYSFKREVNNALFRSQSITKEIIRTSPLKDKISHQIRKSRLIFSKEFPETRI